MNDDILDNETIPRTRVHEYGVVVNLPLIYVSANENEHLDQSIDNYRVLEFDRLAEIMRVAIRIAGASRDEETDIWKTLTDLLMRYNSGRREEPVLAFLDFISNASRDLKIDDEYVDSTQSCITFDVIRRYENDPSTGLLISSEPEPYDDGLQLYSQTNDNDLMMKIRKERNDTDMNRFHYCLSAFDKTLRFVPGYVYDRTVKVINLALAHLCLVSASHPIEGFSSNDLKSNILAYIIDVVIRSRVIQAWQRDPASRVLMSDLTRNYDKENVLVALCKLKGPKERAKLLLHEFSKAPECIELCEQLSYESYEQLLEQSRRTIDGRDYYAFDNKFLLELLKLNSFEAMRRFAMRLSSRDRDNQQRTQE